MANGLVKIGVPESCYRYTDSNWISLLVVDTFWIYVEQKDFIARENGLFYFFAQANETKAEKLKKYIVNKSNG